jgi:hypothetical protein
LLSQAAYLRAVIGHLHPPRAAGLIGLVVLGGVSLVLTRAVAFGLMAGILIALVIALLRQNDAASYVAKRPAYRVSCVGGRRSSRR